MWLCNCHLWNTGVAPCQLDLVAQSGQLVQLILLPSIHFPLPLRPAGFLFLFLTFSYFFFHRRKQSKGRRLICWSRPSISLLYFPFSPALQLVTLLPYSPNHAPSNISPLAFPRFRLLSSCRSRLRSTRTLQHLLDGDTLSSPGERKSGHPTSGHSDGADD